jgi:hypothetical protein
MHWFMSNGGGFKSPVCGLIIFGEFGFSFALGVMMA